MTVTPRLRRAQGHGWTGSCLSAEAPSRPASGFALPLPSGALPCHPRLYWYRAGALPYTFSIRHTGDFVKRREKNMHKILLKFSIISVFQTAFPHNLRRLFCQLLRHIPNNLLVQAEQAADRQRLARSLLGASDADEAVVHVRGDIRQPVALRRRVGYIA